MRHAFAAALVLFVACKKEQPAAGLAPAQDWNATPPSGSAPPDPHTVNPHAGAAMGGGADPHAGVDMGGGADPHAGVDMGGAAPSGGGAMGNPDPHAGIAPAAPKALEKLPDGSLALGP